MEERKGLSMQKQRSNIFVSVTLSWSWILLASVLLLALSTAPVCQGSLVQKRSASSRHPYQFVQNWNTDAEFISSSSSLQEPSFPSHIVKKRDTTAASKSSNSSSSSEDANKKIKRSVVPLNDSHNQLLVFWAGEDVIVCLAKDVSTNTSSTLWISRDYGGTFANATSLLIPNAGSQSSVSGIKPVLNGFFNHPSNNGHFALSDVHNKVIFTTKNYGAEFIASKVEFVPDELLFDPHSDTNIVAYETTTNNKQMWVSIDFGKTWSKVQEHVKSLFWDESVMPALLYLQREEPSRTGAEMGSRSVILKSDSLFLDAKNTEVIITGVEEFEIKDDFMFATKFVGNGIYDLLISYKKSEFKKAMFPPTQLTKHFFIADVSDDGQIFVCVVHNESVSNLYIGNFPVTSPEENPKFQLSLERILYFKKNVTWSDSWLNEMASEPFVDLHHVEGLRGVYIASQLKPSTVKTGKFNMNEVVSLITYDQGGEWQVLSPPEFEHDGRPIYCQYKSDSNCSLHISQRLSELYPRTRAVPILTKKSAVGLVLATGTVNTTLKGHLGVYLSTDGAVSWRQILQGNYVYGFGDHGGIIVATKMYKIGDDTNELLYSIDEGETWNSYTFYEDKVRIMGLMTEPGENTTVFFIFGSVPPKQDNSTSASGSSKHTWVLIKVDFRDVFERNCTKDDYKLWSPWDSNAKRHCLLGRKEIYERRIPTRKCFNGQGYVRPVTNKTCVCNRSDFECDFGYIVDQRSAEKNCIRDNSETSSGVKAEWCRPSLTFYNKTKGYRKIPGDICEEGSWVAEYLPEQIPCKVNNESEFILVAKRDSVLRIDLNHFDHVETLPLARVQAVIAVDFNLKNNCIFWSDVQRKTIMMLHLDGESTPETLVSSDIASVEGIAFDWMSDNLYFTDGSGSKIEVVKVDHSRKRMRKRLLSKPDVEKPRGIVVHPEKGYIFWTDWSKDHPAIGRSHLDGSNVKKIVENKNGADQSGLTLKWPNGITIDYKSNRLFWVDANLDRMMTADLNGDNFQIVFEKDFRISHPFAVGVYKNSIYWDDWTTRGIYTAELSLANNPNSENYTALNSTVFQIKSNLPRLMDLKVYGMGAQTGNNHCSNIATSNCTHLCFANPNETVSCMCPDGFIMQNNACVCPDGKSPNDTGSCESKCEEGRTFQCRTHKEYCIINAWRCDGENDCGDNSDEENCDVQPCLDPTEFKCTKSGRCIPHSFVCDYDGDCGPGDTSDEEDCKGKNPCDPLKHFECGNGRCILKSWRCDEDDDCLDGTDEMNCTTELKNGTFSCLQSEWKCPNEDKCLSPDWLCDFDNDCNDGADEKNCTSKVCPDWKFACKDSGHCIMKTWECDGDKDCPDGSDEHEGCPVPAGTPAPPENPFPHGNCSQMSQMFGCLVSKECIPIYWKCDNVKDCQDGSDELGCHDESGSPPSTVTVKPPLSQCEMDHWRCNDGTCITSYSVCDGFPDCAGREDEANCHNGTGGGCPEHMRRCGDTRACIFTNKWCDGRQDCPNNADERDCKYPAHIVRCNSGSFKCDDDMCQPLYKKCNKKQDCYDSTDEDLETCKHFEVVYQVDGISPTEIDSTWFDVDWWLPAQPSGKKLKFIPAVCEVESGHCKNATEPVSNRNYTFENLNPFKKYSVTVYVVDGPTIHPPFVYINVTTSEAQADKPYGLQVNQNSTEDLVLTWKKPHTLNGKLKGYRVYFQPPIPPVPVEVEPTEEKLVISNKQSDPIFVPGENYTFWVIAVNGYGDGKPSDLVNYVYNGDMASINSATIKELTDHTVKVTWDASNSNVDTYLILLETDIPNSVYTFRNRTETNLKIFDFEKLAAGTTYKVTIIPKHKGMHGTPRSLAFTTKGTPLPKVEGFRVIPAQSGSVKLSWRPAKISGQFAYGIYYGKTVHELAERRARILTTLTQTETFDLEACENYLFDIGIVTSNDGIGPLTEKPLQVLTKMNPQSPPKSVEIEPIDKDGEMAQIRVKWNAPCDVMDKEIGYNITITELTSNKSYGVSNISYSKQISLSHDLKLQYGGVYQLIVSTSMEGGKPSIPVRFVGPSIPFPEKINECSECNPLAIYWAKPNLPKLVTRKGKETYVVWLSNDENFTNPKRYETPHNSFKFTDVIDNGIYFAAVSVKDADGLESPRSAAIIVQHTSGASPLVVIPGSSALAITITVLIVIALLVAVLVVFVVRHKRLQTSFLNFASSHYSSSSGAATFQQTMEEQDSPVIRGFSDDEPLLVA